MTVHDIPKPILSSTRFLFVLLFFLQVVGEAGEKRRPSAAWPESGPGPEAQIAFHPILTKQGRGGRVKNLARSQSWRACKDVLQDKIASMPLLSLRGDYGHILLFRRSNAVNVKFPTSGFHSMTGDATKTDEF